MKQAGKPGWADGKGHRRRLSEHRGAQGDVGDIDHHPLAKCHGVEVRRVAQQRAFFVGAAGGVVEYRPRHAFPRELAQIVDAENDRHGSARPYEVPTLLSFRW